MEMTQRDCDNNVPSPHDDTPVRTYRVSARRREAFEFRRLINVACGILGCCNIGAAYAVGILSNGMQRVFGLSEGNVTTIIFVGFLMAYFAYPAGVIMDLYGSRAVMVTATVLLVTGWSLFSVNFSGEILPQGSVPFLSFVCALFFWTPGFFDPATMLTNMFVFPLNRGTIVIIQKTFMSLASTVVSLTYDGFFAVVEKNHTNSNTKNHSNNTKQADGTDSPQGRSMTQYTAAFAVIALVWGGAAILGVREATVMSLRREQRAEKKKKKLLEQQKDGRHGRKQRSDCCTMFCGCCFGSDDDEGGGDNNDSNVRRRLLADADAAERPDASTHEEGSINNDDGEDDASSIISSTPPSSTLGPTTPSVMAPETRRHHHHHHHKSSPSSKIQVDDDGQFLCYAEEESEEDISGEEQQQQQQQQKQEDDDWNAEPLIEVALIESFPMCPKIVTTSYVILAVNFIFLSVCTLVGIYVDLSSTARMVFAVVAHLLVFCFFLLPLLSRFCWPPTKAARVTVGRRAAPPPAGAQQQQQQQQQPVIMPVPFDLHFTDRIKTLDCWLFWGAMAGISATGGTLVGNAFQMFDALANGELDSSAATLNIGLMGIGGAAGRVIIGLIEESYLTPRRYAASFLLPIPSLVALVGLVLMPLVPAKALWLTFFLGSAGYGMNWAALLLNARQMFTVDISQNYLFIFSAGLLSVPLSRGALGPWYDAAVQRQNAAPGKCMGVECVSLPIGLMAGACVVGVALCWVVHVRWMRRNGLGAFDVVGVSNTKKAD